MLKALLVIISVSGSNGEMPYESSFDMPNMNECIKAKEDLIKQDRNLKALCIPHEDPKDRVEDMFYLFMDIVNQLKEKYPE
tara:strand:- start:194 stop:436 length:243 start_codon:yes stop_codon:yes gene_type:complete